MPLKVYDRTIAVLKQAVSAVKLGNTEKIDAIRRLDEQARRLEGTVSGPSLEQHLDHERAVSHEHDGRAATGMARKTPRQRQLAVL